MVQKKGTEGWQGAKRSLKDTPAPHKEKMKSLEITAPVRRKEMKKDVCYRKKKCEIRGESHFLCKRINATKQRNAEAVKREKYGEETP